MKAYFAITPPRNGILREATRDDSFNIWNFGAVTDLSPEEVQALHLLAEYMPFSYIAIRVSRESILRPGNSLDVSTGLGILRRYRDRLKLDLSAIPHTPGGPILGIALETPDPFSITKEDLFPLLEDIDRRGLTLEQDLVGRIFISYVNNGTFVHGVSLGCSIGR